MPFRAGEAAARWRGPWRTVALPAIQHDFGTGRAELQWVVTAYTLSLGAFLLIGGRAGDLYVPLTSQGMSGVREGESGLASGLFQTSTHLGGALVLALLATAAAAGGFGAGFLVAAGLLALGAVAAARTSGRPDPRHDARRMLLLAIPFGLAIGLIVGAVGGGGAILALPVLVYVLGEGVGPASTASLIVIALAAAVGAGARARHGQVCWRLALLFAAPAAAGSLAGALLSRAVSDRVLILSFVPIMLVAAGATWQRSGAGREEIDAGCPPARSDVVVGAGLGVGMLTGFFGVGGGFMIVPVLALGLGLAFRRAVATSLVIITLTGIVALTTHLLTGARPHFAVTAALATSTVVGALLGTAIADRLPQKLLARGFAVIVALLALFLLADATLLGGPPKA